MSKTMLVDGNYLLHRAFHVVQKTAGHSLEKSLATMVLSMICNDYAHLHCTHICVSFDSPTSFRDAIYADYKSHRHEKPIDFKLKDVAPDEPGAGAHVQYMRKVLKASGIRTIQIPDLESDDIVVAMARQLPGNVVIVTRDKDLHVAIDHRINIWWPKEKKLMKVQDVLDHWGVYPAQLTDYLTLLGDAVDSIPGVPGIGVDTARNILKKHGTILKAVAADPKIKKKLTPYKTQLGLAYKLVKLKTDPIPGVTLEKLLPQPVDKEQLLKLVWRLPSKLDALGDSRAAIGKKGLFR